MHDLHVSPAPLAALTRLRVLHWWPPTNATTNQRLPSGPWLHNLQTLGLRTEAARANLLALAAAQQVESLIVEGGSDVQLAAVFRWAAVHGPNLQRLLIGRRQLDYRSWTALEEMKHQRPGLRIRPF